jgi:hypothetical protein
VCADKRRIPDDAFPYSKDKKPGRQFFICPKNQTGRKGLCFLIFKSEKYREKAGTIKIAVPAGFRYETAGFFSLLVLAFLIDGKVKHTEPAI